MKRNTRKMIRQTASLLAIGAATATAVAAAHADPVAASGYSISLFAGGPVGTSAATQCSWSATMFMSATETAAIRTEAAARSAPSWNSAGAASPRIHNGDRTQ